MQARGQVGAKDAAVEAVADDTIAACTVRRKDLVLQWSLPVLTH